MYEDNVGSIEYIASRLINTVVTHRRDGLSTVHSVKLREGSVSLQYVPLSGGGMALPVWCGLASFDFTSPKLGYVNGDGEAHYILRLPLRRDWKQGLRKENLACLNNQSTNRFPFSSLRPLLKLGEYHPFSECLDMVEDGYYSAAFSRYFAVNEKFELLYRGRGKVGKVDNNGNPILTDRFTYLQEALQEDYGNV